MKMSVSAWQQLYSLGELVPPLTRKHIAFITIHDNPGFDFGSKGEQITATLQIFGLCKKVTYSVEEFNTYRATYLLMGLDNPVKGSVWISSIMFPSEHEL